MALSRVFIRSVVTVTFWAICLIGFIFQAKQVCDNYFSYKITTDILLEVPKELRMPVLVVCSRYVDILNRSQHDKYGLGKDIPSEGSGMYREGSLLTIRQIFDLTPKPEDTIHRCGRRSSKTIGFNRLTREKCLNELNITKFYMQEFICYMYVFNTVTKVQFLDATHSLYWSRAVFELVLRELSMSSNIFLITSIVDPDGYNLPNYSRNFGKHGRSARMQVNYMPNQFFLDPRFNEVHLLPPPYETRCTLIRDEDFHSCIRFCLIDELKVINRFPSSEITTEPLNIKHVNYEDEANETTKNIIQGIMNECNNKCQRPFCELYFVTTSLSSFIAKGLETANSEGHNRTTSLMSFRVNVVDAASIIIVSRGKIEIMDFVVYLCSCFGIWFGLSVSSFSSVVTRVVKECSNGSNAQRRQSRSTPTRNSRISTIIRVVYYQQQRIDMLTELVMHNNQIADVSSSQ